MASDAAATTVLPCPHFEGVEKRVEIDFHAGRVQRGLRSLPRATLDAAMTAAQCLIVSRRSNAACDAYVLSESSLFVYPTKVVLKTCGTTKLLDAVPLLLAEAAALGMAPRRVKYTRSTFLFPDEQPLDGCFDAESAFLEAHFGHLGPDGGNAFVLGSKLRGVQWHVYIADDNGEGRAGAKTGGAGALAAPAAAAALAEAEGSEGSDCSTQEAASLRAPAASSSGMVPALKLMQQQQRVVEPTVSLEVCMTHLNREHTQHFIRDDATFVSSQQTTEDSGIRQLFHTMDIDDYVFEPCGYSMNGLSGGEYCTIHITPEEGFSYCSVEHSNIPLSSADPEAYVRRVAATFKPGKFSFSASIDAPLRRLYPRVRPRSEAEVASGYSVPGYRRLQASHQEVGASGGTVSFYTFVRLDDADLATNAATAAAAAAAAATKQQPAKQQLVKVNSVASVGGESEEEAPHPAKKLRPNALAPVGSVVELSTHSRSTFRNGD
mmetsp:Transcript_26577/g.65160  ORF Transcript_26577/g.65160 Transcript_26577/m.65160 type:complete len:492 (-) Transcript_26577:174-1649(-)|eukprot:CAMPEP_0197582738 /NCGR_PEP_ID=MMETSP1326-20131121/5872_1 /TAXON_ID=1155430 /ORGANISM="Genus nov. species nov., Strain RCC2288" /LENGTH=491 /DNA_ID=CAMNT_0043146865 /DNA_START=725 /DNA_END=2200 /DNA_ORIENTATION=+